MPALRILFLSAEVAPFTKAGGLADVAGSLPKALAALGHEVRVVTPAHAAVEEAAASGAHGLRASDLVLDVPTGAGPVRAGVFETVLPGSRVPVFFIARRELFVRRALYGDPDDPWRYSFFSRAALHLAVAAQTWRPDIVSAHDWHAAPAVMWLATAGQDDPRYRGLPTVFTIHNLAHQGRAPRSLLDDLGVWAPPLFEEGGGEVNFMARGIYHATMITTVSPTYAREITTREGGAGLDGLLRYRHFDLHGILNGIDDEVWNPATDPHLARTFDAAHLEPRLENKRALQARAGLPVRDDVPLCAMVSRLDWQKGLDICGHVFHLLLNDPAGAQLVVLGSGQPHYEAMLAHLAGYHRDKMRVFHGYHAELAPLVYGGSDIFLMPSLFEPCGLGQLIAMRYGSVPVVRATGGLSDTVRDGITGFTFTEFTADDFWNALRLALYIYREDRPAWQALQRQGMSGDYSWRSSALGYQQVFEWAIARARGA